jgi:hypothetical protein
MASVRVGLPTLAVFAGLFVCVSASYGTAEYTKKTKKNCATCHVKTVADKKEMNTNLTTTGTCYKENKYSLESVL